jgi:hypothetical protein
MLEDILVLARSGRLREAPRPVDVAALADDRRRGVRRAGRRRQLRPVEGRTVLSVQPNLLRRALRNLVDNAVKYGGSAEVRVAAGRTARCESRSPTEAPAFRPTARPSRRALLPRRGIAQPLDRRRRPRPRHRPRRRRKPRRRPDPRQPRRRRPRRHPHASPAAARGASALRRRSRFRRREQRRIDLGVGGGGVLAELLGPRGADDRGGDVRLAKHPGEGELGEAEAGFFGERLQPLHRLEHIVVQQPVHPAAHRLAGRPAVGGGGAPGRYLPVSTPWASGDQTICEMPFAAQSGITSSSGSRHSSEYCGWLETNFATPPCRAPPGSAPPAIPKSRYSASCRCRPLGSAPPSSPRAGCPNRSGGIGRDRQVGSQPLQRGVELLFDLGARQAAVAVRHREEDLGRQHVGIARPVLQNLAEELLRRAAPVDVGGVDEVDAEVERQSTTARERSASTPTPKVSQEPSEIAETVRSLEPNRR